MVSDVKYDPSRLSDLSAFYERHNKGARLKEKALQSLGFMNNDGYLLNGAVLFLDNYHEGKTDVQCSVFSGFHKGSERIVTVNKFSGNITSTIDYIMNVVTQRMNHSFIKLNDGRINIDSYPERALFEGVINAVVHRDYYLDGTQIQVDIFKDRLEISSPGGFYRSEKSGKTYDLSGVVFRNRNELIARVLTACKVMEAGSAGFAKTMQAYADADSEHKPYVCSSSDHFTLVLPDLTYERGVADTSIPVLNFAPVPQGTDFDEKVLSFCYAKARKVSEIAAYLGISDSSYFRKRVLANLENNNYLEKSKISKASYYKTNPDMVVLA